MYYFHILSGKLRIKFQCDSSLEAMFLHLRYVDDNGYYFDNGYNNKKQKNWICRHFMTSAYVIRIPPANPMFPNSCH